jgi:MFS family permease
MEHSQAAVILAPQARGAQRSRVKSPIRCRRRYPGFFMAPADPEPKASSWQLFALRDYQLLWGAMMSASIVVWLRIFATSQWLLETTGSPAVVGAIGVIQLIMQIPALLWGGTLADRMDRKRLLFMANAGTCLVMLVFGVLSGLHLLTPTLVFIGIAITSASQMFASPARSAMVPRVVPPRLLLPAAANDNASANVAAVAAPLLFAAISLGAGLTAAFMVSAALGVLATLLPLGIKASGMPEGGQVTSTSQLEQTRDGLSYVAKHPILPGLFLLDTGITVASFYREILPVLALGLFAGGASATGVLGAANSMGAIAGSVVAALFASYRAKGMLVLYASFAYGFAMFGFGLANSLWIGMLMIGLLGATDAVTVAVRQTTVMLTTPDHMRGRAFSIMVLAAQTANNVGTIWVGFWAAGIGAANTMILGGVISVVATALIGWWWKPIRTFRSD